MRCRWSFLVLALFGAAAASAADLALKLADKEPPSQLDPSVRALLSRSCLELIDGDQPAWEFWFVREVPLASKPASLEKALDSVAQATLLGAVSVPAGRRDYRDDEISAGIYTMRLGLQPNDGNHLGTSDYSWFAILVPAKLDPKPDAITDYKSLVKASSKETTSDHPVILSLRPAPSGSGDSPALTEPIPEHKSVVLRLPAAVKGSADAAPLFFQLVYEGKGHK